MIIITPDRIRSLVSECKTDTDLIASLRRHKIRYKYTTDPGFLSVAIPCRTGKVLVYRTASRSNPFRVIPVIPSKNYCKMLDVNLCL